MTPTPPHSIDIWKTQIYGPNSWRRIDHEFLNMKPYGRKSEHSVMPYILTRTFSVKILFRCFPYQKKHKVETLNVTVSNLSIVRGLVFIR